MPKLPEIIATYIAAQPEAVRPALLELHQMIAAAFPAARAEMYGTAKGALPVYKIGETWVGGYSVRAKGPMVYMIDHELVAKYKPQLGALTDGKACVSYRPTKTLDPVALKALFTQMFEEAAAKAKKKP